MQFNVKWRFLVHKRLQIQLTHLRLWCEIKAIVKTTKTVQISFHVEYPWAISLSHTTVEVSVNVSASNSTHLQPSL